MNSGRMPLRMTRSLCGQDAFASSGRLRSRALIQVSPIRARPSTIAGVMPAANRAPIDIPETTPMMIRSIAGGTRVETPPAEAKTAVAKAGGYCRWRIAGRATEPIAAVFALGEPEMPENSIVDRMTTRPRPPGKRPTNCIARSTIRRAMPPCEMSEPARTNSGTASSGKESRPARNFCGITIRNSGEL